MFNALFLFIKGKFRYFNKLLLVSSPILCFLVLGFSTTINLLFSRSQLAWRDRFTGTGLRMGVVCGSAGAFFGVLLFPPLGPSVLKPHLWREGERERGERGLRKKNGPFRVEILQSNE